MACCHTLTREGNGASLAEGTRMRFEVVGCGLQAVVHYGEPQLFQGRDRRAWAQDVRTEVAQMLGLAPLEM